MSETNEVVTQSADAERIDACLRACAGLSTEALNNGVIRQMIDSLQRANEALDVWASRANARVPEGFIPVIIGVPEIGDDHQQIIEKRGDQLTVVAWRAIPADSICSPNDDSQKKGDPGADQPPPCVEVES
jgi:hypothetical protein